MSRNCPRCHTNKDVMDFPRNNGRYNKINTWCKQCYAEYRLEHIQVYKHRLRVWYLKNRDAILLKHKTDVVKQRVRNRRIEIKRIIFEHYGGKCTCCGESNWIFLALDHVNNDGNQYKKTHGYRLETSNYYRRVIKDGFPDTYQLLCFNCNWGKHRNNGQCPHKTM